MSPMCECPCLIFSPVSSGWVVVVFILWRIFISSIDRHKPAEILPLKKMYLISLPFYNKMKWIHFLQKAKTLLIQISKSKCIFVHFQYKFVKNNEKYIISVIFETIWNSIQVWSDTCMEWQVTINVLVLLVNSIVALKQLWSSCCCNTAISIFLFWFGYGRKYYPTLGSLSSIYRLHEDPWQRL